MNNLSQFKNRLMIVGVSGGPDSMALLDMCFKNDLNIIVAFVNYHTRKESDIEEKLVKDYSEEKNIPFVMKDAFFDGKGNFESWARRERYSFFYRQAKESNAEGVIIAHHLDDELETYLMQKRRHNIVEWYGLKEESDMNGLKVYRPLLSYTKDDLISYCSNNKIPYSIDSSNANTKYERNSIRQSIISKMNKDEKLKLLEEIKIVNLKNESIKSKVIDFNTKKGLNISDLSSLACEEQIRGMYYYLVSNDSALVNKLSWSRINEINKAILSNKPNLTIKLDNKHNLIKEYEKIYIQPLNDTEDKYEFIMDHPMALDTKYFSCNFDVDTSFLKITLRLYPLKITNADKNDYIIIGGQKKKINRLFIDEKIPLSKRKIYPVVKDNTGKIVYFPLYKSEKQKIIADKLSFVIK